MADASAKTRTEKDSLGPMQVPQDAYYGASTARAIDNFPISKERFPRVFIRALGLIKRAAAEVNVEHGHLDPKIGRAVAEAAQQVADGAFDEHFPIDIFQTGSGTSTNMNANEVIANRATEILGGARGSRLVHPNDHVNVGQSSNDVIPTAIHVAALLLIRDELRPALATLRASLRRKADEFWPVVKTGRTHLMDATPIRLGQEFLGYAGQVEGAEKRLGWAEEDLAEVALGGTAVGTGTNTYAEFAGAVLARVSALAGVRVRESGNHFQAQSILDAATFTSGVLRTTATSLLKVANDVRWMGSGPRAGLAELALPAVQPGSSIMPGKVNPVIAEALIQACAHVQGDDLAVALGNQWGFFELNTMMPLVAHNLLESIHLLATASANFARQCVDGLQVTERAAGLVEQGLMLATALAPAIGYDAAAEVAKEAARTGRTIRDLVRERKLLPDDELDRVLDPVAMTEPGLRGMPGGG